MSTAAAAEEDEEEEENAVARDGGFERADPSKKPPAVLNKDFIMNLDWLIEIQHILQFEI
jgi:hypothetical protein